MGRTHVTLDDAVLAAIDSLVGRRRRSRFLEDAAREKLERAALSAALESCSGVLKHWDYPEYTDQTAINEWVRSQRRS